jgi:hypothetical protein
LGILSDFERRLEGIIEGVFTKAFRTGLHPVELATRILKEMEASKTVGVREVWVPNRFTFVLSPPDRERFENTEKALRRELQQVVSQGAEERGWSLVGPAEVTFETDPRLKQGEYACRSELVEGPTGSGPVARTGAGNRPGAGSGPGTARQPAAESTATLTLLDKGKPRKTFALTKDRVIIGRLDESDVVVPDPGVSRRHAEVRRDDGEYILSDLGSTNGTMVNEASIGERTLADGDRITVGSSVLEFRRG